MVVLNKLKLITDEDIEVVVGLMFGPTHPDKAFASIEGQCTREACNGCRVVCASSRSGGRQCLTAFLTVTHMDAV